MDERLDTPLIGALEEYATKTKLRLHMPGHKGTLPLLGEAARLDATEARGLDNLHAPQGCILEAERLAAQAFGAARTFFLVNGSSAGILALLLFLGEGAKILLQRDSHKSFISGVALAGLNVSFLPLRTSERSVSACPTPEDVERELKREPYRAVCVTSPNYYGYCPDLAGISAVCKKHGALLFVDEAHGAHFSAGAPFPASASSYASAWVQSAHKTLDAMTQAAYLHVAGDMDEERVARSLSLVQSTSPSYLLMASLDYARASLDSRRWRVMARLCDGFRAAANAIPGVFCPARDERVGFAHDPTRLVIDVSGRGGGFDAVGQLFAMGISVEMADARRVVLIITPSDGEEWVQILLDALKRLPEREIEAPCAPAPMTPKRVMGAREAVMSPSERVELSRSFGGTAAQAIGVYPPGTALVWPGEQIDESMIQYMCAMTAAGAEAFGLDALGRVCVTIND